MNRRAGSLKRQGGRFLLRLGTLLLVLALLTPLAVLATSGDASARAGPVMNCAMMGDMDQPCCADSCAVLGSCAVLPQPPLVPTRILCRNHRLTAPVHAGSPGRLDQPDPPPPRSERD